MTTTVLIPREDTESPGIGLGWLLAIALGGGILLFTAIGLLLSWRIKAYMKPCTTRVYSADDPDQPQHHQQRKLAKKRYMSSSSSFGNLVNSKLSLTVPSVMPPLPIYTKFRRSRDAEEERRGRTRERIWVDEEAMHGPPMNRLTFRASWFSKDGWLATSPTLPDLEVPYHDKSNMINNNRNAPQEMPSQIIHSNDTLQQTGQRIEVQKRQSKIISTTGTDQIATTAPEMFAAADADADAPLQPQPRGRPRVPAAVQNPPVRPCATESDLRSILKSTDQRLREGGGSGSSVMSSSPIKTPKSKSGGGGSPVKTPRSCRSSNRGTPSKRGSGGGAGGCGTPTSSQQVRRHSRTASVTSIGSAANSLINLATAELQLPGGVSSPSRLRGSEWTPEPGSLLDQRQYKQQQQNQQQEQQQQQRPRRGSDASSSLSTLYSVGEPEDDRTPLDDPFVAGPGEEVRQQREGWPGSRGRSKTVSMARREDDEGAMPLPLRTASMKMGMYRMRGSLPPPTPSLPPPSPVLSEEVRAKRGLEGTAENSISPASSEGSMVSVSVHTLSSESTLSNGPETPKVEGQNRKQQRRRRRGPSDTSSLGTPNRAKSIDLSSSPINEHEALSMLMASARPRKLPLPPPAHIIVTDPDSPAGLSPRPVRRRFSVSSSSNYEDEEEEDASSIYLADESMDSLEELPQQQWGGLTVRSTISQLRRMNSVVSSYSVASMASTVCELPESITLTSLRGGGFSPERKNSTRTAALGNRNYRSLGEAATAPASPEKKKGPSLRVVSKKVTPKKVSPRKEKVEDKENEGLGIRMVRFDVLDEQGLGSSVSLSPTSESRRTARHSAQSVESVGLYDKDGFLKASPDGKSVTKGGRLRL